MTHRKKIYSFYGNIYKICKKSIIFLYLICFTASAQTITPGGTTNTTYAAWLTPESYSNDTWTNLIVGGSSIGNFSGATSAPVKSNSGGYNFHPVVTFSKAAVGAAPNQLYSQSSIGIQTTNSIISIFVFKRTVSNTYWDYLIGFSNLDSYNAMSWRSGTSNDLTYVWPNNAVTIPEITEGILTVSTPNIARTAASGDGTRIYRNGELSTFQSWQWNGTNGVGNGKVALGGGANNIAWYGYRGNLQEVILIKNDNAQFNGHVDPVDLQKIHSYLAVKYGITLAAGVGNYINSAGVDIWNRSSTTYNYHIFGIGRDDISMLNQVQSCSQSSNVFTLFKGSTLTALNDNRSTAFPADKTSLMVGANNASINTSIHYPYLVGSSFKNDTLSRRISYRTALIYKAQVTTANVVGGTQTVNMQINSNRPAFVLVSPDSSFTNPETQVRIYPVVNRVAMNVVVNHNDYITFAGFDPTPGGVKTGTPYTLDLWVDGNNSSNHSWENLAASMYSLEKFSTDAPIVRNSKFNFHKEMFFGNAASSKLRTSENYNLISNTGYHIFVVSNAEDIGSANATLLTFGNAIGTTSMRWNGTNSDNNIYTSNWNTTEQTPGFTKASYPRYGITTLNINNTNHSNDNQLILNGTSWSFGLTATTASGAANPSSKVPLLIGNASNNTGTGTTNQFDGSIQEIIIMRTNSSALMPSLDVEKIHSYLAIKYGITISHNYRNSNGDIVWSRGGANTHYNNYIFGIGRDDVTGLYQKQSQSASSKYLTVFVGNSLAMLNSQNTGTLNDMQYLMIGSAGGNAIQQIPGAFHYTGYLNGNIAATEPYNIQSPVYKAQLTGISSMTVKTKHPGDFLYALVSTDANFDTLHTKIYSTIGSVTPIELDTAFLYFKYVGFAPGPGGVVQNLQLWLRADDEIGVGITSLPSRDGLLSGYVERYSVEDPDNIPAVTTWSDLAHGHTYSRIGAERLPVFEANHPGLNFKPAVRFWHTDNITNNTSNANAYLSSQQGIATSKRPSHTTIAVLNNSFNSPVDASLGCAINFMMFGFTSQGVYNYNGPAYGIEREGDNVAEGKGRFRGQNSGGTSGVGWGTKILFNAGATCIAEYHVPEPTLYGTNTTRRLYWRFNGREESGVYTLDPNVSGDFNMQGPSTLGTGWAAQRSVLGIMGEVIIFEKLLSPAEKILVDSYLAFKYGITLRPRCDWNTLLPDPVQDQNNTQRFDYKLSNGTVVWAGLSSTNTDFTHRFYNNIAAVIRDDRARLYNRHAHSTDVGSIVYMGLAGTMLTDDGDYLGYFDNDGEAIVWGSEDETAPSPTNGIALLPDNGCGDFTSLFRRKWMAHKTTLNDRPLEMLVSARNNGNLTFGMASHANTSQYYNALVQGNDFFLIIADSPQDLDAATFNPKMVIPMTWIDGKHQVRYTFTNKITYFTFGFKPNGRYCAGNPEAMFDGVKTFNWTQYTANTNRATGYVPQIPATPFTLDLGNNITCTTFVTYPSPVSATYGYPRTVTTPSKGSLELRRTGGRIGNEMVVKMQFSNPVIPFFSISGIDGPYNSYEWLQVDGKCGSDGYLPHLTYASGPNNNTAYNINGTVAKATKNSIMEASNLNGRMNVTFEGGVTEVVIRYRLLNRVYGTQRLFISPVMLRTVLPLPPFDESGISFLQTAMPPQVSLCREVTYTYQVQNANCATKKANFSVALPAGMKWLDQSLALDSAYMNNRTHIHHYGETKFLTIDSLVIPGNSTVIFSAVAYFEDNAQPGTYTNKATLEYELILHDTATHIIRESCDGLDVGCNPTTVTALPGVKLQKLEITDFNMNKTCYKAGDTVTVNLQVRNPNVASLPDAVLEVMYNEEFHYIPNSFHSDIPNAGATLSHIYDDTDTVSVSGGLLSKEKGNLIFLPQPLPFGYSNISFKLAAPSGIFPDTLVQDCIGNTPLFDINGFPVHINLDVSFDFFTLLDNDCASLVFENAYGNRFIPEQSTAGITVDAGVSGTVFPFVHRLDSTGKPDTAFNKLFEITAELYAIPVVGSTDDPIAALFNTAPLFDTVVKYYDGSVWYPGIPKYPGEILHTDNPGVPIHWDELFSSLPPQSVDTSSLQEGEMPASPVGIYSFKNVPAGDYILVLSRAGYITRFAEITITDESKFLGHRELIPGDMNRNVQLENADISEMKLRFASWNSVLYKSQYDVNADKEVDAMDLFILLQLLKFQVSHYSDTRIWLLKY